MLYLKFKLIKYRFRILNDRSSTRNSTHNKFRNYWLEKLSIIAD